METYSVEYRQRLLGFQFISNVGDWLLSVAFAWMLLDPRFISLNTSTMALVSIFAGAMLASQLREVSPKLGAIVTNLALAVIISVAMWLGNFTLPGLIIFGVCVAFMTALKDPFEGTLYANTSPLKGSFKAISAKQNRVQLGRAFVGILVLVFGVIGIKWLFYGDAVSFVLMAAVVVTLKPKKPEGTYDLADVSPAPDAERENKLLGAFHYCQQRPSFVVLLVVYATHYGAGFAIYNFLPAITAGDPVSFGILLLMGGSGSAFGNRLAYEIIARKPSRAFPLFAAAIAAGPIPLIFCFYFNLHDVRAVGGLYMLGNFLSGPVQLLTDYRCFKSPLRQRHLAYSAYTVFYRGLMHMIRLTLIYSSIRWAGILAAPGLCAGFAILLNGILVLSKRHALAREVEVPPIF